MHENNEIKQINESEFWIGECKYQIIKNNILFILVVGDIIDKTIIAKHKEITLKLMKKINGPINVLIDVNKAGSQSSFARKTWQELSKQEGTEKVAFFGLNSVAKILASFVMGIVTNKEMRFFNTREEAFTWLNQ